MASGFLPRSRLLAYALALVLARTRSIGLLVDHHSESQVLEEVCVGPVPVGISKFILQADAPDLARISQQDLVGVTVVLITCSYREKEFVRIGYYVNNEYYLQNPLTPMHPHATIAAPAPGAAAATADPDAPPAAARADPQPVPVEQLQEMLTVGTQLDIGNVFRNIM